MKPDNVPGLYQHREITDWDRRLKDLSFHWTGPNNPDGQGGSTQQDQRSLIHNTFSSLIRESESPREAFKRCYDLIERTLGDEERARERVIILLDEALLHTVVQADLEILDRAFDKTLKEDVYDRFYAHSNFCFLEHAVSNSGLSRDERGKKNVAITERFQKDAEGAMRLMDRYHEAAIKSYDKYIGMSVEHAVDFAVPSEAENIRELFKSFNSEARESYLSNLEKRLGYRKEQILQAVDTFSVLAGGFQ